MIHILSFFLMLDIDTGGHFIVCVCGRKDVDVHYSYTCTTFLDVVLSFVIYHCICIGWMCVG
jgi:hypothetical protein